MIPPDSFNGSALKYSGCMQVEHEEMERIIAGAEKDAAMNKIEINIELKKMSYCAFVQEYDPSSLLPGAEQRATASDLGRQLNHSGQPEPEPEPEPEHGGSEIAGVGEEDVATLRAANTQLKTELAVNRQELAAKDEEIALLKAQLQKLQPPTEGVPPVRLM